MIRWTFSGVFFLTLITAVALRVLLVSAYKVGSDSMAPEIVKGDFVLGLKTPFIRVPLSRGDIVAVQDANGRIWVRRLVGLPGDKVESAESGLLVNGQAVDIDHLQLKEPVLVGLDKFFVASSVVSEPPGPQGQVPKSEVTGRLSLIWFSAPDDGVRWNRFFKRL